VLMQFKLVIMGPSDDCINRLSMACRGCVFKMS
jgi:hypothetical protein